MLVSRGIHIVKGDVRVSIRINYHDVFRSHLRESADDNQYSSIMGKELN